MKYLPNLRNRIVVAALFCLISVTQIFAQQEVMYSQYMFNTLAINPAYAGSRDVLSLTALGRYQWLDKFVPGAPTTHSFSLDMPFYNEKMGIGISAYNDAIGVANNTGLNLAYAYRFKVGEKTTMSLGVQPTYTNVSLALSQVNPGVTENLFNDDRSRGMFNVGLGTFISNDRSYFGFSVPQILEQRISAYGGDSLTGGIKRRHYFTMMGFVLGKGNFKVKPSTMLRYAVGSPLGIDGNINVWYKDKIALGISGRKSQTVLSGQDNIDAIVGMFELQLTPQLRIGLAYDHNRTNLRTKNGTDLYNKLTGTPTYEWLLRYEFGYGKSKILTPRYF